MTTLRHAVPRDAEGWLALRCALWPHASKSELRAEIEEFFAGSAREPHAVLLAEAESGEIVGVAELSIRTYAEDCVSDRIAYLEGWYVSPNVRRRGIGRALLAAAERWGEAQGCTEFASDAELDNEVSRAAHLECGFAEVGRIRCFRKELTGTAQTILSQKVDSSAGRQTTMQVRAAQLADASELERLLAQMIKESYPGHRGSTADELRRDVLCDTARHRVLVAEQRSRLHGFISWDRVYDMHWARSGGQIADLYVLPASRGRGFAIRLLASCCSFVQAAGGSFIRGGAYDQVAVRRLYSRFAIVMPNGGSYCSGRAFRHLATLSDADARSMSKSLPSPSWNLEE